ncbi:MAG: purine-binding chemotaxis protein CheW [Deltaproteobacteria bacterium]|nr:purine-binding chemotaxis protein CheW [Deltaproteobacteria bacterium]
MKGRQAKGGATSPETARVDVGGGGEAATLTGEPQTAALDPLSEFFVGAEEGVEAALEGMEGPAPQRSAGGTAVELLAFWVGDEEYAIEITQIQEIIKVPTIAEVPRAPAGVLGIISLRGTIVPVVDLRVILRLDPRPVTGQNRVLVLRGDGDPLGVQVDRVSNVVRMDKENIEPVPRTMRGEVTELLAGVGRLGERLLIVLELSSLLAITEGR